MRVFGVYDKNSKLKCHGKNVFSATEEYLKTLPKEYSTIYYKNKESIKILRVDKMPEEIATGKYNEQKNTIIYSCSDALGHEIVHMATNDMSNNRLAIDNGFDIELALIEGMTEYINTKIYTLSEPISYPFEVFCVSMMDSIPDFFKYFFIPNGSEFVKLFPSQKKIYSLMYNLNIYQEKMDDYLYYLEKDDEDVSVDFVTLQKMIKSIIDYLISIELSFKKSEVEREIYSEKFMDLISSELIRDTFNEIYSDYINYAFKRINKKVRKRGI